MTEDELGEERPVGRPSYLMRFVGEPAEQLQEKARDKQLSPPRVERLVASTAQKPRYDGWSATT